MRSFITANLRVTLALLVIAVIGAVVTVASLSAANQASRLQQTTRTTAATPSLTVSAGITTTYNQEIALPLLFNGDSASIASTAFTVNFDPACLRFDSADANNDSIPDTIELTQNTFSLGVNGANAAAGQIRIVIFPPASVPLPALNDGNLLTVSFVTACTGDTTLTLTDASFGDTAGASVAGVTNAGTVTIETPTGVRGDCNADTAVDAADLSALVLEIFDNDGDFWLDTPNGAFAGNAKGCDSNVDTVVNAGDMSCSIRLLMEGNSVQCSAAPTNGNASLSLPALMAAQPGQTLSVPLHYRSNGYTTSSMTFALRYDPARLTFSSTDADNDNRPDALALDLPTGFQATVLVLDNGEIQVGIYSPMLRTLPEGQLATIQLGVRADVDVAGSTPALYFNHAGVNSLGDDQGRSLPVVATGNLYLYATTQGRTLFLPNLNRP